MKEFLNDKLKKLGEKRFFIIGPLASLLSDLILIYYVNHKLLPQMINYESLAKIFKIQHGIHFQLTFDTFHTIKELSTLLISLMLFGVFLFNCVIAYNVFKRSAGSIKYLKGYTFSAVFLSIFELGTYLIQLHQFNTYTFITMALYFFTYYGLKYFKIKNL